jgi:hypothetical protein
MALSDPSLDVPAPLPMDASPGYRAGQENSRLQAISDALPDPEYARALGLGATHGLRRKLAARCARLDMAINPFLESPAGEYDLIVACDVLTRLDAPKRDAFLSRAMSALKSGGHLVLAHWLDEDEADKIAADFIALAETHLPPVSRRKTPHYRVDVLERA